MSLSALSVDWIDWCRACWCWREPARQHRDFQNSFASVATEKHYLAWVEGNWQLPEGTELVDWMSKNESAQRMMTAAAGSRDAQEARLQLQTIRATHQHSLMAIQLLTGRKHQIRLQLSARGHPILGDRKYDAASRFAQGIALHSQRLILKHPTRDERLTFEAPVPKYWPT